MKFRTAALCAFLLAAAGGCGTQGTAKPSEPAPVPAVQTQADDGEKRILVRDQAGHMVQFRLYDNPAAEALYGQLPLTAAVEDFSTNEKMFYPAPLPVSGVPLSDAEAGEMAYYAPWDDVAMFFAPGRRNDSLYALGRAEEGLEDLQALSGQITVEKAGE